MPNPTTIATTITIENFLFICNLTRTSVIPPLIIAVSALPVSCRHLSCVSVVPVLRVLSRRTLQLHRNLQLGLVDLVVFPKSLETRRQHLHPQRTIRNPVNVRPPI